MKRPALAALLALASLPSLASPCAAPAEYVRGTVGAATAAGAERLPLLRPYVLQGLAVTALRQVSDQLWLELAVDSEATARRALAGAELQTRDGVVLLACRGAPEGRRVAAGATALW